MIRAPGIIWFTDTLSRDNRYFQGAPAQEGGKYPVQKAVSVFIEAVDKRLKDVQVRDFSRAIPEFDIRRRQYIRRESRRIANDYKPALNIHY